MSLALAQRDAKRILNGNFKNQITLKKGNKTVTVQGLAILHHLNFDTEGLPVNAKTARVTVVESDVKNAGIETRTKGEVYLKDTIVSFLDESGTTKLFNVCENFADDVLGIIVLVLQNYVE